MAKKGKRSKRMMRRRQRQLRLIVAGAIALVLLIGYGIGVRYYGKHLMRNTRVNGTRVGNMTVEEAEAVFEQDYVSHTISLKEKERVETVSAQDVGLVIEVGDQITNLKASQNPWGWMFHLFGGRDTEIRLAVSCDRDKLKEAVGALECFKKENITKPKDAYIKAGDKQFEIVPEVIGNAVRKKKLIKRIEEAFATGVTKLDLEKEDLYKLPRHYSKDEDINKALKKANKLCAGFVIYDLKFTRVKVGYHRIRDWIVISDDFKVSLDESAVGDFVEAFANKYNTMGVARKFKGSKGKDVTITNGDYGWKIYFKKEKAQLLSDIRSGKEIRREPVYSYKGMCRNSLRDDIGDSYVEVSIDDQMIWLYVGGKMKGSSSCVTGNPKKKAETIKGIFAITYKQSPATLTGPNARGGEYSSEVDFWMPFNGNQGLHNAPWRKQFGGNIYKTNGSHGCVNLPYDIAKLIYDNVEAGYPVIVY